MFRISFYGKKFSCKPTSAEIADINNRLTETELSYTDLAKAVGEYGCSFAPAVFNGRRKQDNFREQQIVALDFDNGTSFSEIKARAERYGLPILLA